MAAWFTGLAALLLLTIAAALWRIWRGPTSADRMMAAQLIGSGGVAVTLLLAAAGQPEARNVGLVLALLAAFAAVAFIKAASHRGAGDPEADDAPHADATDIRGQRND